MTAKRDAFVPDSSRRQISRREALQRGMLGSAGLLLAQRLSAGAEPTAARRGSGRSPGRQARRRQAAGKGQGGHPDLAVGRSDPHRHVRSQAGSGQRLHRSVDRAIETNVKGIRIGSCSPSWPRWPTSTRSSAA